jgi:hypothetical protein
MLWHGLYIQLFYRNGTERNVIFQETNETERYFFWNRNEIKKIQKRNGTKKKCFLTPGFNYIILYCSNAKNAQSTSSKDGVSSFLLL